VRRRVRWPVLAALLLSAATAGSVGLEPVRPGQENSIVRAVFAANALWLLTDAGTLWRILGEQHTRVAVPLDQPALDLWLEQGAPAIVTRARDGSGDFALERWSGDTWTTYLHIPGEGEPLVGVSARGGAVTLLTLHRLIDVRGGTFHARPVSFPPHTPLFGVTSILATRATLYIGINGGEWGGGLRQIDRRSGGVSSIEARGSGLCEGALNGACDPVNGIATEPWKPDCVIAVIGLVHMLTHGRIDEVCAGHVRVMYSKPAPDPGFLPPPAGHTGDLSTIPFYGVTEVGSDVLVVGLDGLYRLKADGTVAFTELPPFETIDDVQVSFALPEVVLVLTSINQRRALSGRVPMLVPR
jgi:hypothetical protein